MKWNTISTGDIALRKGGSVDPKKHQDEVFELYSVPAFDAGAPEVAAGSAIGSAKKAVRPNDVMISRIVPHIRRACVVGPANGHRQIASGEWIIFRDERIWPKYLRWVLVGDVFHSAFMRTVSGVGGSLLRARPAEVFKIQIPLPPLGEQKRIAGILDAADALRAKRREALVQLDSLLQSTFLDMFGDPVTNPMGWEVTTVNGIGSVQGGLQVTSMRQSLPIERPYLRVANVFRGFLELDELKTIRLTEAEELRTSLEYEDILIVEGHGNKEEIGRCALWDGSIVQCVHQNHLIRLRCDRSKASPLYVENYINSPGGRRSLAGTSRTTSGLNTISVSKVRGSEIQLPPLDLQQRFAAIVESIEQQKTSQRAHLVELDTLFASLQSRAFRGDL